MSTPKTRILIGTSEKDILREPGGTVVSSATGRDDLVRRAASEKFGLIILFGQTLLPGSDRADLPLENSVRAIQEVKAKVTTPILALFTIHETSGWCLPAQMPSSQYPTG